jgi:hypothetical protein
VYVEFEFDTPPDGLEGTHLARLLLDLQHLLIVAIALGRPRIESSDPALDLWIRSYKGMAEATHVQLGDTTSLVAKIVQNSPLTIGLFLTEVSGALKERAGSVLRFIFDRIFFADLERERRQAKIEAEREEIRQKRIDTLAKTFDLVEKIGDPALRASFVEGLESAIRPFEEDHPRIRRAEVTDRKRGFLE